MSLAIHDQTTLPFSTGDNAKIDRSLTARRLLKNAISLVSAHPKAEYLGPDILAENLAYDIGFGAHDLAILRVSIAYRRHTIICAPEPVWSTRKSDLLDLKAMCTFADLLPILVPESAVQRQPRLGTARVVEQSFQVSVTLDQRMAVIIHLIDCGGRSSILDCAHAISHHEPFSAVMHLVSIGVLNLNSNSRLTPETEISLAEYAA